MSKLKPSEILARIKSRLPHSTQQLIKLIGWQATLRLLHVYGGRNVYFPQRYNKQHFLYRQLSHQQARALHNYYKGQTIQLPRSRKMLESSKYSAIVSDHQRGMSVKEIAKKNDCTTAWVYEVVNSLTIKLTG